MKLLIFIILIYWVLIAQGIVFIFYDYHNLKKINDFKYLLVLTIIFIGAPIIFLGYVLDTIIIKIIDSGGY